jgi:hypothetical protein
MKHWRYNLMMRPADTELYQLLVERTGHTYLRQRLGIEAESEHRVFHKGRSRFHIENIDSLHGVIRFLTRLLMLHGRGQRNALNIRVNENVIQLPHLPEDFIGYTILHLSDLHMDMNDEFPATLHQCLQGLEYDMCVMTGDYRFLTHGPWDRALAGLETIRTAIDRPIYAVLGNHDSLKMAPGIEDLDIRLLLNESVAISRGNSRIHLAGIDDPHYFGTDNLERATRGINDDDVALLLAHSPEIFRQAAHAGFDVLLCGHTHGGQIRLPGNIALIMNAKCPRAYCAGAWQHRHLRGYTSLGTGSSIVDLRYNCPPEVTLHRLHRS